MHISESSFLTQYNYQGKLIGSSNCLVDGVTNPAPGKQWELINPTTMFLILRQCVPQMSLLST